MIREGLRRGMLGSSFVLSSIFLAGCDKPQGTDAGITNGPPPSASDKAAVRSDLPGSATPTLGEKLGQTGDNATSGGSGAMGGGTEGNPQGAATPKPKTTGDEGTRANPPSVTSPTPSTAAGGTKPAETIKDGSPK